MAVTGLPAKQWLLILCYILPTASLAPNLRVNNVSTGTPYADRTSTNQGADATDTGQNQINVGLASASPQLTVIFIENTSTNEKLVQAWTVTQNTAGAANIPDRKECVGKWADTTNPITEIDIVASTSTFATGSEVVVLGADPGDTVVTPFFVEQGRVTRGSNSATINVTGLTAKKYMLVTLHNIQTSGTGGVLLAFNNDGTALYNQRTSSDGAADSTSGSNTNSNIDTQNALGGFSVFFVINTNANEKIFMGHSAEPNTIGAANVPHRMEFVGKYAKTSAQITEVDFLHTGTGNYETGSEAVVYGSN